MKDISAEMLALQGQTIECGEWTEEDDAFIYKVDGDVWVGFKDEQGRFSAKRLGMLNAAKMLGVATCPEDFLSDCSVGALSARIGDVEMSVSHEMDGHVVIWEKTIGTWEKEEGPWETRRIAVSEFKELVWDKI